MPAVNITTTAAKAFEIPSGSWGYRMHNASDETIYTLDNAAVTVATGMPLAAGAERTVCFAERSRQPMSVQAIHAGSGNKSLRYEILTVQLQAASRTSPSGGAGSFGSLTGVPGDNAALAAALAAKLPLSGGTMTGVLTAAAGSVSAPAITFTGAGTNTGIYSTGANTIDFAIGGVRRVYIDLNGTIQTSGSGLSVTGGNIIATNTYLRLNGPVLRMGASDDLVLGRFAAAGLQLGTDHASSATNQTIKAHNVTTGSGANLILCGGTGSVMGGSVKIAASTTTGAPNTLIEVMPSDQLAFFGTGGSTQPNTGIAGESHVAGSGTAVTEDSTFGGYTLMQVVAGLRALGLFQ